ncbi:MAG: hypothetical protein H0T91_01215, partial [Propionibacteriaceae bacterium]|nr:hypothetical protein [Propionibacteriaceae bacterium]
TQVLARGVSRRRVLNAAGAMAGGLALRRREALAQDDLDTTIDIEDTGPDDIPQCAACLQGQRCIAGECCPEKQACDDVCCPPETVGCTAPLVGPDGSIGKAGCLCPEGLFYHEWENTCRRCEAFGEACRGAGDCCTGVCLDGACSCVGGGNTCTGDDQCCIGHCERGICTCVTSGGACGADYDCCGAACVDGVCSTCTAAGGACRTNDECCGKKSHSGKAPYEEWGACVDGVCHCCYNGSTYLKCGRGYPYGDDLEYPSSGLCCDYPLVGYGCCADPTDCSTCIVGCCTDGVDCDVASQTFPGCPPRSAKFDVLLPDQFACTT